MIPRTRVWVCRISAVLILGVVGMVWFMIIDRDPPFIRISGHISPPEPKPEDWITAIWETKLLRRGCKPYGPRALSRTIIDGAGRVIDIEPVEAVYDGTGQQIVRSFQLPAGLTPGPARYRASACFACGINPLHYVWPICVDKPEISFVISRPAPTGIQGERGPQGERGERGEQGAQGEGSR